MRSIRETGSEVLIASWANGTNGIKFSLFSVSGGDSDLFSTPHLPLIVGL
jgi:hypothetical protein